MIGVHRSCYNSCFTQHYYLHNNSQRSWTDGKADGFDGSHGFDACNYFCWNSYQRYWFLLKCEITNFIRQESLFNQTMKRNFVIGTQHCNQRIISVGADILKEKCKKEKVASSVQNSPLKRTMLLSHFLCNWCDSSTPWARLNRYFRIGIPFLLKFRCSQTLPIGILGS